MLPALLRPFALAFFAVCLGSLVARADESGVSAPEPNPSEPLISLETCVASALAKNFNVRIQAYSVNEAKDQVIIAQSAYDPVFGVTWQKTYQKDPIAAFSTTTGIAGSTPVTNEQYTAATLSQPVETGGTISANYQLSRSDSNIQQALINPAYDGQTSIAVIQPLLQGAGLDYGRATIQIAQWGAKIAQLNFKSTVLTTVFNVETAYYNLIYARRQYAVAKDTLALAQQLLDENTGKRRAGILTDLDVAQARTGEATARSQLIGYKQAMDNAGDVLLEAMGERSFTSPVGRVDFPALPDTGVSFDLSYKLARDNGPNLAVIAATIEQFKLDALRAKRNNLPQLNATGGAGYLSADTSYSRANSTLWNGPGYDWNAGLSLSIPWGMRANRALYRQAMAHVESEEMVLDQTDQALVVQVRAAVRSVQANVEAASAATQAATFSLQQYHLQKAKFDAGLATSYDVLQAQNLLESARNAEIQSQVNLRIALADLHFLEGTSLSRYRINLN